VLNLRTTDRLLLGGVLALAVIGVVTVFGDELRSLLEGQPPAPGAVPPARTPIQAHADAGPPPFALDAAVVAPRAVDAR
jgi:hypothetical protein